HSVSRFGIWNLEFGIWNLEFGIWNLEFGIWNLSIIKLVLQKLTTMGFLDKMKTAFGTAKTNEEIHDSSYVENIINSVENSPFAVSKSNVLYGGNNELAGYHYFQTVIIGTLKLKTHQGAKMAILGDDFTLDINSDMLELESEISNQSNTYVTKIEFEIDKDDIPKLLKSKINSLEFFAKKENIKFFITEISDEEE
ncbi:MAG: hypothetical protein ABIO60_08030, partial [Aquaticitalea sp.]